MASSTVRSLSRGIAAALLLACLTLPAGAETYKYKAVLKPLFTSDGGTGSGGAQFTYESETSQLEYIVVFENLSGPATGGHIHSAAEGAANGTVVVRFPVVQSPIGGTATLSPSDAALLEAGKLYVDIHTEGHSDGELRGEISK
jgi:hypothetical protein